MRKVLLITFILFFGSAFSQTYIQLILDSSGSMYSTTESGQDRIDVAKAVLTDFIGGLPAGDLNVGLRIYGANLQAMTTAACEDSHLIVPMQGVSKTALLDAVTSAIPKGATPIAYSLQQAIGDFENIPNDAKKVVIIVTDGEESCEGNLKREVDKFRLDELGIELRIIGFGLDVGAITTFEGVGDTFENVIDAASLEEALNTAAETELYRQEGNSFCSQDTVFGELENTLTGAVWVGDYIIGDWELETILEFKSVCAGYIGALITHKQINPGGEGFFRGKIAGDIIIQYYTDPNNNGSYDWIDADQLSSEDLTRLNIQDERQIIRLKRFRGIEYIQGKNTSGGTATWNQNREYRLILKDGVLTGSVGVPPETYNEGLGTSENGEITLQERK